MAISTNLPDILKGFPVRAIWQGKAVSFVKATIVKPEELKQLVIEVKVNEDKKSPTFTVRLEDLSTVVVVYEGTEIPLSDFDWSWKGRFKRMRKDLGHSYGLVADITGNKVVSIHRVVSSKNFPRNLRYAVHVWEEMHARKSHDA